MGGALSILCVDHLAGRMVELMPQGTTTINFGAAPTSGTKRFYFHKDATLAGAPNAPTGCATLSETVPDATDASSVASGHTSTSTGVETSLLNKPGAKDETGVAGIPPVVNTPAAAHQFGWFSDIKYNGTFIGNGWTFQWREDDSASGIVGNPIVNIFASTTRDFVGTMRFLGQLQGVTDWWAGAANTASWGTVAYPPITLTNEYIFVQVWCHETAAFAAGQTLTFHQEGSDLTDAQRSSLISPTFQPVIFDNATATVTGQVGIVAGSLVEAWILPTATADHTVDEHWVDPPRVVAGNIVPGVGFTIYGTSRVERPIRDGVGVAAQNRANKNFVDMPYGVWTVAWAWA
jgi:hypothetical protein